VSAELDELAVLADELQERGDPQGELIATQLAIARLPASAPQLKRSLLERRFAGLLERHHDRIYGELAPHVECTARPDLHESALEVTAWRHGFADEATIQTAAYFARRTRVPTPNVEEVYRLVRTLPIAARLRSLRVGSDMGDELAARLVADPPPQLRELRLAYTVCSREPEDTVYDLAPLVPLIQRLESLVIERHAVTPPLESDTLRSLGWVMQRPERPFVRSRLPKLQRLVLGGGAIEVGFCAHFPALEELKLFSTTLDAGFVEELLASRELEQLRELDLPLTGAELELVMRRPDRVTHLKAFRVTLAWFEPQELRERARAVLPCVTFG
jgi:hypothetical protein